MREQGLRLVLGRARVGVGHRMAERCGIETMQSGLRDYHWPVRMALPRFSEGAQHLLLNRIGHLHYREDEMRLPLTPGDVAQRIVVRFTEPTRVEKAQQRRLAWEVIKRRGTCAGLEALPDLGALITRAVERAPSRALSWPIAAAELSASPNSTSLIAFQSRSRGPTVSLSGGQ